MRKFFSDLWKSRRLIILWTRYNIESAYLEAKLGVFWIVLQPILLTLIYAVVFSMILDRKPRHNVPFVLFFLSGMILWQFFSNNLMKSASLMASKINMVSQIKFPRASLVLVEFLEQVVDFAVTFLVLLILDALYGFYPNAAYVYLPLLLLVFFSFTVGTMFMLTTFGVFIQDVPQITSLALRFLMYFSGVLISADMLPKKATEILIYNPLFFMIESFRNIILYSESPDMRVLSIWLAASIAFFAVGVVFFKMNDGKFADHQ